MISLNYRDSRPIYEQIEDELRRLIVTGAMAKDEKLPSVRALATQLSINPNTIQKAYGELEREGVIYSLKGRGSFVGSGIQELRTAQQQELMEQLFEISGELCDLQVPQQEVCAMVQKAYEQEKGGLKS